MDEINSLREEHRRNNPYDREVLESRDEMKRNVHTINMEDLDGYLKIKIDDMLQIGQSRGGGIVLLKTNEDVRIKKVITLAGVCDFEKRTATKGDLEDWKKTGVKYVLNGRTKQKMPHFYQFYLDFIKNENRLNIKKATQNLKIPHLIIHGNKDTSVLIDEANNLKKWNPKSEFVVIEGANHVFNTSHPWKEKQLSEELGIEIICM